MMVRIVRDKPLSATDREMVAEINRIADEWVAAGEARKAAEARAKAAPEAPSEGQGRFVAQINAIADEFRRARLPRSMAARQTKRAELASAVEAATMGNVVNLAMVRGARA
jgi:hypothetical protein